MKTFVRLILASILLTSLVVNTHSVQALSQSITITPTSSSPVINPGESSKGTFQVVNQGESQYPYSVYATQYRVSGQDYTPDFTNLPDTSSVDKWFDISSSGGTIEPGKSATIGYTISVPANTAPGGYYAAIFAQSNFTKPASGGISLNQRVGEIFYIQVAGPVVEKGRVTSWVSKFFQKPPISAGVSLENSGGLHYPAGIEIFIKDIFGHSKYTIRTTKEVLPQTIRKVPFSWDKSPSIGLFKISGRVTIYDKDYQLQTRWVLVMSQTVRLIMISVLSLSVLFVLLRLLIRKIKAKKSKRS